VNPNLASVMAAIALGALLLAGRSLNPPAAKSSPVSPSAAPGANPAATLVWSDEFNAPDGSAPDPKKWTYDIGGKGWGNNELESYTGRRQNVAIQGGNLVIQALKETYTGPDGVARDYTSARLKTQRLFTQKYGRIEARIKIPYGQGLWPAFWMLGDDIDRAGWPACGEIDIFENIGREPSIIHGTVHGPGYSGGKGISGAYALPGGYRFADGFHVFSVEWQPNQVTFLLDANAYKTVTPADLPPGAKWVFDHPFFLILNLAVGGNVPASPDISTDFPQRMLVDYVRVYSRR